MEEVMKVESQELPGFIFKPVVVAKLPRKSKKNVNYLKSIKVDETIREYLLRMRVQEEALPYFVALKNASVVGLDYKVKLGDNLLIAAQPEGFGGHLFHGITNTIGHVLSPVIKPIASVLGPQLTGLALSAAGAYFGPMALSSLSGAFASAAVASGSTAAMTAASYFGQAVAGFGSTIGSFLASSIGGSVVQAAMGSAPIQQVSSSGAFKESQSYTLLGQSNRVRPFDRCTMVYGKRKTFPPLATYPDTIIKGEVTEIRSLMDLGINDYEVTDIKIGDTPIADLTPDSNIEHNTATPNLRWLNEVENYASQAFVVKPNVDFISQTKQNTKRAIIVVSFPRGLYHQKDDGNLEDTSVNLQAFYKDATNNADTWHPIALSAYSGLASMTDAGNNVVTVADHFTRVKFLTIDQTFPSSGIWDIKVVNQTAEATDSRTNNQVMVTAIINIEDSSVGIVHPKVPHTWLEVKAQSSEKLQGSLNQVTCVQFSKLRWHDGNTWQAPKTTSNPAWVVLDILTGVGNDEPLRDDQIDFQSFVDFAHACDEQVTNTINGITTTTSRFQCNLVVDVEYTVGELVDAILSESRAHIHLNSAGKYAVVMDKAQTEVRQVFSPSNSWGFGGTRGFIEEIHAYKVAFTNPARNWSRDEVIVYNDGYSVANASNIKEISTFAITSYQEAWRFGRYQLALARHQQELFKFNVEAEVLGVDIGDLVEFCHDVPEVGGYSTHVKSVSGTTVELASAVEWPVDPYFVLRRVDGQVIRGAVKTALDPHHFDTDVALPNVSNGDMIVIGEKDHVVKQYIVRDISISGDFTGSLTLVPYVPAIYEADKGKIPDWDSGLVPGQIAATNLEVHGVTFTYTDRQVGLDPITTVHVAWNVTGNRANLDQYTVEAVIPGLKPILLGTAKGEAFTFEVNQATDKLYMAGSASIKVTPIAQSGAVGLPDSGAVAIPKFSTKPADPIMTVTVTPDGRGTFDWSHSDSNNVREWELRRTRDTGTPDWTTAQVVSKFDRGTTSFTNTLQTGTYMLKAIGLIPGLESTNAAKEFIDIHLVQPGLGLHLIRPEDAQLSEGVKTPNLKLVGNSLVANMNIGDSALYTYPVVDLGSVQTFRIEQHVQLAVGKPTVMHEWDPISIADPLHWIKAADPNTYREVITFRVASTDPTVNPNAWSGWTPMTSPVQATGQYVQMQLIFVSTGANGAEFIIGSGEVAISANPRKETFINVQVTGTKHFTFVKEFASLPSVSTVLVSPGVEKIKVENVTTKGFDVKIENPDGSVATTAVDITAIADGFGAIH
jgi:hypothetical protein